MKAKEDARIQINSLFGVRLRCTESMKKEGYMTKKEKPSEEPLKKGKTAEAPQTQIGENIMFIGRKPAMSYVLAAVTSLSAFKAKEITPKVRGRSISKAVDTAEITRRRFIKDLKISKTAIGTDVASEREEKTEPEWFQHWKQRLQESRKT
jgi:DNA-binding protein